MNLKLPSTPRTKLAMLRIGVVEELFNEEAPNLESQLKLQRELIKIREAILDERISIIQNGIDEYEYESIGEPIELKDYVRLSLKLNEEQSEEIGRPQIEKAVDSKFAHSLPKDEEESEKEPILKNFSEEYELEWEEKQEQRKCHEEELLKEELAQLSRTLDAEQFAEEVIKRRLDEKHEEYLEKEMENQYKYEQHYSKYEEEMQLRLERYEEEEKIDSDKERMHQLKQKLSLQEKQKEEKIMREKHEELLRQLKEAEFLMSEEKQYQLDKKIAMSQKHELRLLREEEAQQELESEKLASHLTRSEAFVSSNLQNKREEYFEKETELMEKIEHNREQVKLKQQAQKEANCVYQYIFEENQLQNERKIAFRNSEILLNINKEPEFDYNYLPPRPAEEEKKLFTINDIISGEIAAKEIRKGEEGNDATIEEFARSESPILQLRAVEIRKEEANQIKKESQKLLLQFE